MTSAPLNTFPWYTANTFCESWFLKMKQPENCHACSDSALCIVQLSIELVALQALIVMLEPLVDPEGWRQKPAPLTGLPNMFTICCGPPGIAWLQF